MASPSAPARSAPDAVYMVLGVVRQVIIDDVGNAADMQPTRRHVGRHQYRNLTGREPIEQAQALLLWHTPDRIAAG